MTTRKRSGSGSKRHFREKVVQIYECIFKGDDMSANNALFWDEFFLLKPKVSIIEAEIQKMTLEQFAAAKQNINLVFNQGIDVLDQQNSIRVAYSLQTLCSILHSIFKKSLESQIDCVEFLRGFENYETKIQKLLTTCQTYLEGTYANECFTYFDLIVT